MTTPEEAPAARDSSGLGRAGIASLAGLAAALVFAIALGFALAFGSDEPSADSIEERWARLGVAEAEFVFIGDLTAAEQASIRRELKAAQVLFADHFGAVTSDFVAYVSTELRPLNERLAEDLDDDPELWYSCGGMAPEEGVMVLILEGCPEESRAHGGALAHEYFHILQYEAGPGLAAMENLAETANWEPWLGWGVEGTAEYAAALAEEAQGQLPMAATREGTRLVSSAMHAPLPHYRAPDVYEEYLIYAYRVGFLATEWLMERARPSATLDFFRFGGDSAAFEAAFGLTLDEFHDAFERHRQEVAPPFEWRAAGVIVDPDGLPVRELIVEAIVRVEGKVWEVGGGWTDETGAFRFRAPGSGYTLALAVVCFREDVLFEPTLVGEWGADGFVAAAAGASLEGGQTEGAAPFGDGDRDRTDLIIELPETRESLRATHCGS